MTAPKLFATLGHNKLKRRSNVVAARMHNNREMVCENVDQDGPAPEVVFGPADTWAGVKARLAELEITPGVNTVHAVELVMGASEGWWAEDEHARLIQMRAYERMAWKYLRGRYPPEAIISLTWHLDESNWHLHVIVLPIRRRVDGRFRDKRERWTLCARGDLSHAAKGPDGKPILDENGKKVIVPAGEWRGGIGGIQHMEREQTIFASVMSVLQLERGKQKSRDGDGKSTRQYRIELKAKTAEIAAERDGLVRERTAVAAEADRQRDDAAEIAALRAALAEERTAHAGRVAALEADLAARRAAVVEAEERLAETRAKAVAWQRRAKERAAELDGLERQEAAIAAREARLDRDRNALDERAGAIADLADAARLALGHVDTARLPAELRPRIYAVANEFGIALEAAARVDTRVRSFAKGPVASHRAL